MRKTLKSLSIIVVFCLLLAGCNNHPHSHAQGYIEGDFTYISSQVGGVLRKLYVNRGMSVKKGERLFALEQQPELDEVKQAEANLVKANADLANLLKGKRPSELAAIEAAKRQAEARLSLAEIQLKRFKTLSKHAFIEKERLDQASSDYKSRKAELAEVTENLITAKLTARTDRILAARASVSAAKAVLKQAEWRLAQKFVYAPTSGLIFDTLFRIGEVVKPNQAVISLLAPEDVYALFFVPETQLAQLKLGQKVEISCDNCMKKITATISFISPKAEYTPPVIFSNETRAKLIYQIRAKLLPKDLSTLHPGQPITVSFNNAK